MVLSKTKPMNIEKVYREAEQLIYKQQAWDIEQFLNTRDTWFNVCLMYNFNNLHNTKISTMHKHFYLDYGLNPNLKSWNDVTPLGYVRNVEEYELYIRYGADNMVLHMGHQCLLSLFAMGRFQEKELVEHLLKEGFDPNRKDKHGRTPLMFCNSIDKYEILLKYGANEKYVFEYTYNILVPHIETAEKYSDMSFVRYLINRGYDVNKRTRWGTTVLMHVNTFKMCELLLYHGANPYLNRDYICLHIFGQEEKVVKEYLKKCITPGPGKPLFGSAKKKHIKGTWLSYSKHINKIMEGRSVKDFKTFVGFLSKDIQLIYLMAYYVGVYPVNILNCLTDYLY